MFLGNTYLIPAISNLPGQGTAGTPSTFMLDIIPGAFVDLIGAYSLRRLTSTYVGPACRVRRPDGVGGSLDVNFDPATGYIDIAPAITLCGQPPVVPPDNAVLIETWYDQSGNGNDLTGNVATLQSLTLVAGATQLPLTAPSGFYYLGEGSARKLAGGFSIPAGSDITTFATHFHPFASGLHSNWRLKTASNFLSGNSTGLPQRSNITGVLPGGASVNLNGTSTLTQNRLNLQTDILTFDDVTLELEDGTGLIESQNNDILIGEQKEFEVKFFVNNVSAGTNSQSGEYPTFIELEIPGDSGDDNDPAEFLIYKNDKSGIRADIDNNTVSYYSLP